MSRFATVFGVCVLLLGVLLVARTRVDAEPVNAPEDKAQVAFDALKERLPALVEGWCKDKWMHEPKVRIARRTSPNEAKVLFLAKAEGRESPCSFALYLHYFDGAWTVMRWEAGETLIDPTKVTSAMLDLGFAIDEFGEK